MPKKRNDATACWHHEPHCAQTGDAGTERSAPIPGAAGANIPTHAAKVPSSEPPLKGRGLQGHGPEKRRGARRFSPVVTQRRAGAWPATAAGYVFGARLPLRLERGLSSLRSPSSAVALLRRVDSSATEDGQAASPSTLFRRPGISRGPWDCPTRMRRKRRAPSADRGVSHSAACAQAEVAREPSKALLCARPLRLGTSRAPFAGATATLNKDVGGAGGTSVFRLRQVRRLDRRDPSSVAVLRRVDARPTSERIMPRRLLPAFLCLVAFLIRFAGASLHADETKTADHPPKPIPIAKIKRSTPVDFDREILPILKNNCLPCHNKTTAKAK